jgi:hypothetical protein
MDDAEMMDGLARAEALLLTSGRESARAHYAELWERVLHGGDQYQACVIAHFLARAQEEPEMQRDWHLRALRAAESAQAAGDKRVEAFYPSLCGNLADVSLRLGDPAAAHDYLERARAAEHLLPDDGYGRMIRGLIARLTREVESDQREG